MSNSNAEKTGVGQMGVGGSKSNAGKSNAGRISKAKMLADGWVAMPSVYSGGSPIFWYRRNPDTDDREWYSYDTYRKEWYFKTEDKASGNVTTLYQEQLTLH